MGIYVKFTKTTHQIWSCHVTLASNSENFNFCLILHQILGKGTKFGGNWLKNKKVTGKKQIGRRKTPPPSLVLTEVFQEFCGRYQDLIEKYQRSVSIMVNDSFPG